MLEMRRIVPDADTFLALSTEELAAKILFAIQERRRRDPNYLAHLGNSTGELFHTTDQVPSYPAERRLAIEEAYVEAFCWLEVQGLLIPTPDFNGSNGFRVLSRRGRAFQDEGNFQSFATARHFPQELIHPIIRNPVWLAYARADYEAAVFAAMKAVEVTVRDASRYGDGKYGTQMMREAFGNGGPLCDPNQHDALIALFVGAIGSYKNPHSHRNVALEDPIEAAEIITLASHLLRIVDDRRGRLGESLSSQQPTNDR